jgi:hypothetical protein
VRYQFGVYFDGPRTQWSDQLHDSEFIYLGEAPCFWLARFLARGHCGNTGRCGYVILRDGKQVEHVRAEPIKAMP